MVIFLVEGLESVIVDEVVDKSYAPTRPFPDGIRNTATCLILNCSQVAMTVINKGRSNFACYDIDLAKSQMNQYGTDNV